MLRRLRKWYLKIRFGKIRWQIIDTINGIVCEEAWFDCKGRMIGYKAYGEFDPTLPYRGE